MHYLAKVTSLNFSDSFPGLAAASGRLGAAVGAQRDWHWLGVVHRGLAVPFLDD